MESGDREVNLELSVSTSVGREKLTLESWDSSRSKKSSVPWKVSVGGNRKFGGVKENCIFGVGSSQERRFDTWSILTHNVRCDVVASDGKLQEVVIDEQ